MFRELFRGEDGYGPDITKDFCIGGTFTAGEDIALGCTVAIDTNAPGSVLKANSNDPLRRAVVGITCDLVTAGNPVRVAMFGRVAVAIVVAGAVKGDPLATTVTSGSLSVTPGAGKPFVIGTLLADEAAGVGPVWIGPSAA